MVFELFSPQARYAVVLSQELAREGHRRRIHSIDVLIALSMVPSSESAAVLGEHAAQLREQRARRGRFARARGRMPTGHLPMTADTRKVMHEADRRGADGVVSTSDLLEASAVVACTSAWGWMRRHHLDLPAVTARGADVGRWEVAGSPMPDEVAPGDVGNAG